MSGYSGLISTMQNFRGMLRKTQTLWATCLIAALLIVLSSSLHLYIYAEHSHDNMTHQHSHKGGLYSPNTGKVHDVAHGSEQDHKDVDTTVVDISPAGLSLSKYISSLLLAIAFTALVILLIAPDIQSLRLIRRNNDELLVRGRIALSPPLRAPPL